LVDGGRPARAAEELLAVAGQAVAAGGFAAAELFLREADQISATVPETLRITVASRLAEVLLQAGRPAEAGRVAERAVAVTDGRDPAAATAMRLVLARTAAMTARWDDARAELTEVRRSGIDGPAVAAEIALVVAQIDGAAAGVVKAARWPELWFGAVRAVARGADGDAAGAHAALTAALDVGRRYPVFCALVQRLAAEAALRDHWGIPQALLRSADLTFTQLRLGRASAACRTLLKAAGHPAPRRRGADAGLPSSLITRGVTVREAEAGSADAGLAAVMLAL
jgi:hypothetical protein